MSSHLIAFSSNGTGASSITPQSLPGPPPKINSSKQPFPILPLQVPSHAGIAGVEQKSSGSPIPGRSSQ